MKLLQQILNEAGADLNGAFTVVPSFGGYFKSVKRVVDFSDERIILALPKMFITVAGSGLEIDKYFQGDLFVRGKITGVTVE